MKLSRKSAVLVLLLLLPCMHVASAQELLPVPRLKAGDTFRFLNEETQSIAVDGAKTQNQFRTEWKLTVLEFSPMGSSIEVAYDRFATSIGSPAGTIAYDSKDPGDGKSPLKPAVDDMLKQKLVYQFDPLGNVRQIDGIAEFQRSLGGRTFGGAMDETILKRSLGKLFLLGANKQRPLAEGDTWETTETTEFEPNVLFVVTFRYKLDELNPAEAFISVDGDAKLTDRVGATLSDGSRVSKSEIDGVVIWDSAKGIILLHDMSYSVGIERKVGGQTRTLTIKYDAQTKQLEDEK